MTDLRLLDLTLRPCSHVSATSDDPHWAGTARVLIDDVHDLDLVWHYGDEFTVEAVGGSGLALYGGNLALTPRVNDFVWHAMLATDAVTPPSSEAR